MYKCIVKSKWVKGPYMLMSIFLCYKKQFTFDYEIRVFILMSTIKNQTSAFENYNDTHKKGLTLKTLIKPLLSIII